MKLIIATAAAAVLGTAAFADESTRYNDLRLDTSDSGVQVESDTRETVVGEDISSRAADLRLNTQDGDIEATVSSRNKARTPGQGYIYGGYGEGNDSR